MTQIQFNIFAYSEKDPSVKRNFLVESAAAAGGEIAKALFLMDNPGWEVDIYRPAQCFASGEHRGQLSVWEGQKDRTVVLCQQHGENPPQ